ncbi:MAG: phosphopyruvate hydratase [Minisyncoccia bacterium]|jgi:enolase
MHIDRVIATSVLDTRGRPTVATTLSADAVQATASIPSGKSTGSHEAFELRDTDGGVARAIKNVNEEIATALVARNFDSLDALDTFLVGLDGTTDKSRLGANAILSVSIAAMRLSALEEDMPLWSAIAKRAGTTPSAPHLYVNVINGGAHADFRLPFQEYLLVVDGKTTKPARGDSSGGSEPLRSAFSIAREIFTKIGERLSAGVPMGDEGGYAPMFDTLEEPLVILASLTAKYPGTAVAIDAAADELFRDGAYQLFGKTYTAEELFRLYENLATRFPFHSIEDPFFEGAADDFTRLTAALGEKILIIGDDLTVTNPVRITDAARNKEINAVLIKPNQIGTVREAILAVQETYAAGFKAIASNRSGETDDTFIADFAYGIGAYGIKAGGFAQRERLVKYERLLAIEREAESVA